ncbi:uncharacterized protein FIESC28_01366 [Fusarium coffeatum]|uniref:Uncharacterized protein n=1 Tax=Fusarium coffeatum TaxID=231269 RepID=A0A366S961_9HYPO|nr:uncharacterized protein FIESC28_01366 [Fusarium coffeatum]RBR25873.1 hypothetical protein FIESC28_01366 [Fusarium coffeatum]
MDTKGNSRLRGHRDQSPLSLDPLKVRPKGNCCYHMKNWCHEMYDDLKDMGKNLKNAFRPDEAEEAQQKRERDIREFLNLDKRNPRDHTFRVLHPEPQMVVG